MKKYRKFLSLFMALVMFLGVNLPFTNNVQAAVMTEVAADINLTWEQSKKIKDIIAISKREDKNNEVVLSWDYGEVAGNAYNGDYLFTYNPEDGKEIQIIITKGDGITKISYRVKNLITDKFEEGSLAAYDEKGEKAVYYLYDETDKNWKQEEASSNIWQNAETDGYTEAENIFSAPAGIKVEAFTGYSSVTSAVYGADITLKKDTAVAFKYNGNLVTVKWQAGASDGKIYLGLENIDSNKIYNFNVHCEKGTEKYNEYIQVLRALDFKVQPYAELVIEKTKEPDNYPGREQELKVEISLPQVWDEVTKTYSDTKEYKDDRGYEGLSSNLILKVSETTTKSINFIMDNIYDENCVPKSIGTIELQAGKLDDASSYIVTKDNGRRYYSFKISGDGLEASTLYHSHSMTVGAIYKGSGSATELSRLKTTNYKIDKEIPHTYLKYDSMTQSDGQRVLVVTPYNANGSYYVHRSTSPDALEGENSKIAKYEYSVLGGANTIIIPISNTNNYYYRIEFEYEMGSIFSQILLDNPDGSEYLKTPVLEIPTYKIITETSTQNTIEKVRVVLKWQAGNTAVLKKILDRGQPVTYTFLKTPFSAREGAYAEFLKVEIEKKGENDFGVKLITDDTGMNQEVELLDEWGEYETGHITSTSVTEEGKEVIESNFTIVLEYEIHNEENLSVRDEPSKIFYYPSIYYVKTRGSYFDSDNIQFDTPYCKPVNITLDANAKALLSPPQEVKVTDVTAKTFKVQWDTMGKELYGDYLEANNCELQENGVQANLFITETNVINADSSKQLGYFDDEKNRENMVNIPFNSVLTSEKDDDGNRVLDLSAYISDLRAGKMLKITGITQESNANGTDVKTQVLKITGLDKNTIYYTAMSTLLKVINKLDNTKEDRISDSISTIISFTTKKEDILDGPNPNEVPPMSPADFRVDEEAEVTPTKVTLIWSEIEDTPSLNSVEIKKEYQLVRTETKIDEKLLSKRNEFEEFYEEDLGELSETQKRAWRTDSLVKQPENLYLYDDETKVFKVLDSNEDYTYEYEKRNPTLEFVDYTLMPNRIYYYYIRTVRMAKNETGEWEDAAFSSWEPLTYTTQPVTAPIGLKLERNETYFKYDKETEAVISFFAAIPAGTTMEEIANLYPLEYAIMKDGGEWQIGTMEVTDSKVFKDGNEEKEGYRHFVYKITGLEQGKGYTVKVRMKARINDESEEVALYDVSLYSNAVQFRTNMNQEDYDTDVKVNKWLNLFDEKVMELSQKNYWLIENGSKGYEAIYRTNTFDGELQKAISSIYSFEAENQKNQVYYIPSLALENMNEAGIGVMLSRDGMQATIRANSIDANDTQAVKDVLEDINAKEARDYYIRIEATWSEGEKVNNLETLSEQLELEIDIVSTKDMEKTLDAKFVRMFEQAISGSLAQTEVRRELAEDIEDAIKDGDSNEVLYQLVMDAVDEVYEEIMGDIDDEFSDNIEDYYGIDNLQKNIIITAEINSDSTVSGYIKNGTLWNSINTNSYSNKKGFEINKLGVFVFAGKEVNIPNVAGIGSAESIKDIIAKYGLDDYLGKDIIDTNADTTRYMVIGCVARIAGASSTQNEVAYLKSKGVKVSSAKLYDDITNQEAIYFVMALYEIKTGTKIDTIRITNYNNSEFLNNVDSNYKKSVQAALQLGIFDDASIGAKDSISIATYLDYLGKLNSKINLK